MKKDIQLIVVFTLYICLFQNAKLVIAEEAIPLPPELLMKQEQSVAKILKKSEDVKQDITPETKVEQNIAPQQSSIPKKTINRSIDKKINIGVNKNEGDIYLPLASTICIFINDAKSDGCRIKQYDTSVQAAQALLDGDVDLLITNALLGKNIVDSKEPFNKNMQNKKLRFVLSSFDETLFIVARKDTQIKKIDDLKQSSINLSKDNSKTRMFMNNLMQIKNFNLSDFTKTTELDIDESIDAICNGNIQVISVVAEKFNKYLKKVTRSCDVNIVRFSQDEIDLFKSDPQYVKEMLEGGLYVGMPTDIETVATKSLLLTTSDVPSDVIYLVVETIFKHLQAIQHLDYAFADITTTEMFNQGRIIQFHDGVIDFIKNNGYASVVQNFSSNN